MQLHACPQQRLVGLGEAFAVRGREFGTRQPRPADRVRVAQPAAAGLQIGFQQECHLAALAMPAAHGALQLVEPPRCVVTPVGRHSLDEPFGQGIVAGEVAGIDQRRCRVDVRGCQVQRVGQRSHSMAQLQLLVPDRVPQAIGQVAALQAVSECTLALQQRLAAVVQQEEIDVAAGAQLAAAVPADRHERHARACPVCAVLRRARRRALGSFRLEALSQPRVGQRRQRRRQLGCVSRSDQGSPPLAEGRHLCPSALRRCSTSNAFAAPQAMPIGPRSGSMSANEAGVSP